MEFGSNREGFCDEDHLQAGKSKLHFSYNSSSSSPSSSLGPPPPLSSGNNSNSNSNSSRWETQIYENHQQIGPWSGSKYDHPPSEEDHSSMKLDLMDEDARSASCAQSSSVMIEKEHMFDKVVTPSDVGKLNRLVIPKQHAEKYFPLDSSANEKGLLLNFEDRNGKPWRFRYSYWNSSQSYVMTKGWSRFVKDKKLDAGDVVSFQRGVGELGKDRLYIDWKRRVDVPDTGSFPLQHHPHHLSFHRSIPWSPLLMRPAPPVPAMSTRDHLHFSQMNHYLNRNSYYGGGGGYGSANNNVINPCQMGSVFYLRSQPLQAQQTGLSMGDWQKQQQNQQQQYYHLHQHQQQQENTMVFDSVPVVQGKAAAKRLRLFGVNMDCPISETSSNEDEECDDIVLSSTTVQQHASMPIIQHHHHQLSSSSSSSQAHHPLQLRLYNGTPMPPPIDFLNKGKTSMSFD